MRPHFALSFVLLALAAPLAAGCSSSDADADSPTEEQALERSGTVKTLVRGVANAAGLVATDKHVYFSINRFVASGDPELDQQFAYWEGKYVRSPLEGGRKQEVTASPISWVRLAGKKLFMKTGSSCWISSMDTTKTTPTTDSVYTDPDCTGEGGGEPAGFEVIGNKLVIVRENGEVHVGKLDGTDLKKVGTVNAGSDSADEVEAAVQADGDIFVVTPTMLQTPRGRQLPQSLYRVSLTDGSSKKVFDFDKQPSHVVSDGKTIYFVQEQTKVFSYKPGASAPKLVTEGLGRVYDLAADGNNLVIADGGRGAVYIVKDPAGTPQARKKLIDAKGISSVTISDGKMYFSTDVIENDKAKGIIGVVALP